MESMNGRERVIRTIEEGRADRLPLMPITMTLAADLAGERYENYATDWLVLVRGQMAVAETFGFDHVSAISDPAVESSDLGGKVVFYEDEPPANDESGSLLADKSRLLGLAVLRPEDGRRMSNRLSAVSGLASRTAGELMVEGWVEGPCAEAADLRGLSRLMTDFFDDPEFVAELLDFVTEQEIAFALAQIRAGADLIGVGDAASSLIGPSLFAEFMAERHRRYVEAIHGAGALARLHICGSTAALMSGIADFGYDIVDLDTASPVANARARLGPDAVILGNIDTVSVLRGGSASDVCTALEACFRDAGARAYIVGAGCEIPRDSPKANIVAMRDFAMRACAMSSPPELEVAPPPV
jgi:MtaA/CmuA family methyltransferase